MPFFLFIYLQAHERLQAYEAFVDYPSDIQRQLCRVAHYQRYERVEDY